MVWRIGETNILTVNSSSGSSKQCVKEYFSVLVLYIIEYAYMI